MGVMLPSLSSYFQVSLNAATRDIATQVKAAYSASVITGKIYRLVYDLNEQTYWIESGPDTLELESVQSLEKQARKRKVGSSSRASPSPTAATAAVAFQMDTSICRKKISLPRGVVYEDILTEVSKDPLVVGLAYSHFFPHGLTEQTIVHLKDQSRHQTSLVITPLVGDTDVYDRYVTPKEIF